MDLVYRVAYWFLECSSILLHHFDEAEDILGIGMCYEVFLVLVTNLFLLNSEMTKTWVIIIYIDKGTM